MSDEEHDEESHEGGEGEEDSHEGGEGDNEDENKDDIGGGDDGSSDEEEAPPPKESFIQKWKNLITGKAQPATTYGPPYLKGMPQIDKTLIDECDMVRSSFLSLRHSHSECTFSEFHVLARVMRLQDKFGVLELTLAACFLL